MVFDPNFFLGSILITLYRPVSGLIPIPYMGLSAVKLCFFWLSGRVMRFPMIGLDTLTPFSLWFHEQIKPLQETALWKSNSIPNFVAIMFSSLHKFSKKKQSGLNPAARVVTDLEKCKPTNMGLKSYPANPCKRPCIWLESSWEVRRKYPQEYRLAFLLDKYTP